jgi:hypothetical protein
LLEIEDPIPAGTHDINIEFYVLMTILFQLGHKTLKITARIAGNKAFAYFSLSLLLLLLKFKYEII